MQVEGETELGSGVPVVFDATEAVIIIRNIE